MTRINCIPVKKLRRSFLVAEYREMLRLRKAHPRKATTIPASYRLGKGHVTFFYDKGEYLNRRHRALVDEMKRRGYNPAYTLDLSAWPASAMNDWTPSTSAKLINVARLINRAYSSKFTA